MEILRDISDSMYYYFNALSQFGYKNQEDTNKLLIYDHISRMLTEEMRFFITEEDYKLINKVLHCLYGRSCLIPYPKYIVEDSLYGKFIENNKDNILVQPEQSMIAQPNA